MKHRITIAIPIAMLGAIVFVLPAAAQRGVGAIPVPGGRASLGGSFRMGGRSPFPPNHPIYPIFRGGGRGRGRGGGPGWGYLPYPDYYDYSNYEPPMPEAPPPESASQAPPAAQPERLLPHL